MDLHNLIFNPKKTYTLDTFETIIWIPRSPASSQKIPCLYLASEYKINKILIFFHGRGDDLAIALPFLKQIQRHLNVNILSVEYPGYGLYPGKANPIQIQEDSEIVFEFLRTIGYQSEDIIIMGMSMGSGPASHLASVKKAGALILISPYTSIVHTACFKMGSWVKLLLKDMFRNIDVLKKLEISV